MQALIATGLQLRNGNLTFTTATEDTILRQYCLPTKTKSVRTFDTAPGPRYINTFEDETEFYDAVQHTINCYLQGSTTVAANNIESDEFVILIIKDDVILNIYLV